MTALQSTARRGPGVSTSAATHDGGSTHNVLYVRLTAAVLNRMVSRI